MSGFRGRGGRKAAPAGYVAGLGRGALGFTTRSDVGPMSSSSGGANGVGAAGGVGGDSNEASVVGSGSRSAELRAVKLAQSKNKQQQQKVVGMFGVAPQGYVPGAGRGAGMATSANYIGGAGAGAFAGSGGGGGGGDNEDQDDINDTGGGDDVDPLGVYEDSEQQYDQDDDEADKIWAAIDERMNARRRKRKYDEDGNEYVLEGGGAPDASSMASSRIGIEFRELKEKLADVSEDQWASIPDVGDYSLKYKQRQQHQQEIFTPLSDSLLDQRSKVNLDATAGNAKLSANTTAGTDTNVVNNLSGVGAARGAVLGRSLDKMSDSVGGQTVVDPQGYLTGLSNTKIQTNAEVSDINKARLLLKSVRETNPKHGPGWIASARVEEAAGKILQARKIIQEGCQICDNGPTSEDVWLEAARLHPPDVAKSILATAVRRLPTSVKIFLRAADLEHNEAGKKAVLRKALEANPTSVTLWKAAIELEDANDARILLSVAVEKIPHSVEMWLALARLETYTNGQKVLNKARKALPAERAIWIAAAKLEEAQQRVLEGQDKNKKNDSGKEEATTVVKKDDKQKTNTNDVNIIEKLIDRAVKSLARHDAIVTRAQWLQEAENAELADAPLTSAAIIKYTVGNGVDVEDRQRTWADDAKGALSRGRVATARAILAHALQFFPNKRNLWMQTVDLERKHGTPATLDEVLAAASERLPRAEIFWLLRAKENWLHGDVDKAREILTRAFAANPDSEAVWLAAAKLEWETGEIERAQVLLQRARERAPTSRVYMKSALLEREQKNYKEAIDFIEEGILKYPKFPKLYMMGGQIYSIDIQPKTPATLDMARKFYQRGLQQCPNNVELWTLATRLEEDAHTFSGPNGKTSSGVTGGVTKARGLLEIARLKNPKNPQLWLESIRLERRSAARAKAAANGAIGNNTNYSEKLAKDLTARALQECPDSGLLLAENITSAPRVEQKSKSADAIKRCPEDPLVICAVASLFASERKYEKARKWFDRAVILNPDIGDTWVKYYVFEKEVAAKTLSKSKGNNDNTSSTQGAEKVKERCIAAEPRYGELWTSVRKDMANRRKSISEVLELAAKKLTTEASALAV